MHDEQPSNATGAPSVVSTVVDELVATRAAIAALHARELEVLATAQRIGIDEIERMLSNQAREREMPLRSIAAELACATRGSDRTMQRRMDAAHTTVHRCPVAVESLRRGRIDKVHLDVIVDTGARLTGECAEEFDRIATEVAERETPGRLRPALQIVADRLHPQTLRDRHARAAAKRGVSVADLDDGMAELCAVLPAALARGIHDRLTAMARMVIDAGQIENTPAGDDGAGSRGTDSRGTDSRGTDSRRIDEIRADVLADLLLTGHADAASIDATGGDAIAGIRGEVQVTIPLGVLTGSDESEPAVLAGHGPIDPETARCLAGHADVWTRILTDPVTRRVVDVDRYRPTPAQRRFLRVRDERCRFPGCRQPVWRCDIDHTHDAARGGKTHVGNLAHLCRRHHTMKHATAWTVRQLRGGHLEWTSPGGRIHTDRPERTVRFIPAPDPPPF